MKKQLAWILCFAMLLAVFFTGCSKEVAIDSSSLQHITLNGDATGTTGTEYTATLVPDQNYVLPQTVTVTVDGTALTDGYTYDSATGALTVTGDAITGDIAISAVADESILGTWTGTIDISEVLNTTMEQTPDAAGYFSFSGITFDVTMVFDPAGTASLTIGEESVQAAVDVIIEQMTPGMNRMVEDLLAQQGLGMTVDEFLAMAGMTMEELLEQSFDAAMTEEMADNINQEGKFLVKDGILYLSDDLQTEVDEETDGNPYTITDGVLTIQAGEEESEETAFLFPLVLKRVP